MLQKKNIDIRFINVLENWFCKHKTIVKWEGFLSHEIALLAGVRQGGILFPFLFTLYVDSVLDLLESSGRGCFVNFECFNSFMYADDLILIRPTSSVTDLQSLLSLCANAFANLDLSININKSHCLRVGPRFNASCVNLTINGVPLNWVHSTKYLGITFCNSPEFKCDWSETKHKFYGSANAILGRLGTSAPASVLLKLFNSHSLQTSLYDTSATNLSKAEITSFKFAYDSVFNKIFKSFNKDVIQQCQFYSGCLSFNLIFDMNRLSFLNKLFKKGLLDSISEVDKLDYNDLVLLRRRYNISDCDSKYAVKCKFWKFFENIICQSANV